MDYKKLFELAGVDSTRGKAKKLVEQQEEMFGGYVVKVAHDNGAVYYVKTSDEYPHIETVDRRDATPFYNRKQAVRVASQTIDYIKDMLDDVEGEVWTTTSTGGNFEKGPERVYTLNPDRTIAEVSIEAIE